MFMRTSTSLFIKRILYENINAKKLDSSFMQLRNITDLLEVDFQNMTK